MKSGGVVVRIRRRFRVTTNSKHGHPVAPNLLARPFGVDEIGAVNRCWASDITYVDTQQGWLYLAVILDLRSRRVVGWSMSQSLEEQIVLEALRMALARRQPGRGIVHHSDRGSQYAGEACRKLLRDHGMVCSMSRRGDCWDFMCILFLSSRSGSCWDSLRGLALTCRREPYSRCGTWLERRTFMAA